jgi:hypothetical protein
MGLPRLMGFDVEGTDADIRAVARRLAFGVVRSAVISLTLMGREQWPRQAVLLHAVRVNWPAGSRIGEGVVWC